LYPSLLSMAASNANPFASDPAVPAQTDNPYVSPRAAGGPVLGLRPHRGGLVLTLGLLGFFCCQFFAIAAWIMGYADLKEIDAGRMDPTGRGLTQAGMIIGIIGTVLMILYCGFQMLMIPLAIMNGQ
jgi:hypothetical protein